MYYWNLSPEKGYWYKTNILIRVLSDEIVQQHSCLLTLNRGQGQHHVSWNLNSQWATWTGELVINRNNLGGCFAGWVNTSTNTKCSRNVGGFLYLKLKHSYTACQVRILSHIFVHWNIEVTLNSSLNFSSSPIAKNHYISHYFLKLYLFERSGGLAWWSSG